jgi:type I restriction enzyme S subunit
LEVPYLRVANVQDGYVDLTEIKTVRVLKHEVRRYLLEPGDVLMTEGGDFDKLGRGTVWRGQITPCLHQNHIFRVRTNRQILLPEFLAAVSSSEWGKRYFLRSSKQTTNLASINSTQLKAFPVLCPPIDVQHRIADVLDAADAAIRRIEAVIAKLRQMKAGLLRDLLTRGLDEQGRLRDPERHPEHFKESPVGRIPQDWDIVPVDAAGEVRLGRQRAPQHQSGQYTTPYLRVANVFDSWIDYSDVLSMDFTPVEREIYALRPGDILLNEGQSIELVGRSAIYEGNSNYPDLCFQNTLVRFRCYEGNQPEFCQTVFKHWLDTGRFTLIARQTTSVAHLGADRFARMLFPRPRPDEQDRITLRIRACTDALRVEEAVLAKLKIQKRGLMQDLLTGRVRV